MYVYINYHLLHSIIEILVKWVCLQDWWGHLVNLDLSVKVQLSWQETLVGKILVIAINLPKSQLFNINPCCTIVLYSYNTHT